MPDFSLMNMPDMGATYDQLIGQTRPTAPAYSLPGPMQGFEYARDRQRQQEMMDRATKLAELDAMMRAQRAGEYERGAPGRNATIDVANQTAQGTLGNMPATLAEMRNKALAGEAKSKEDLRQQLLASTYRYATEWNSAKDKETKQYILDRMEKDGVTFGKKKPSEVPVEEMDKIMKMHFGSQVDTPAQAQAIQKQDTIGGYKLGAAGITGIAGIEKAKIAAAAVVDRAKLMAQNKLDTAKPLEEGFHVLRDTYIASGMTKMEAESEALKWYQKAVMEVESAKAGNQPSRIDLKPQPGMPFDIRKPQQPQPTPMPVPVPRKPMPSTGPYDTRAQEDQQAAADEQQAAEGPQPQKKKPTEAAIMEYHLRIKRAKTPKEKAEIKALWLEIFDELPK